MRYLFWKYRSWSPYDQTLNGATVLENGSIADFALLEIDNLDLDLAIEYEVFFAGWDHTDEETVTEATGIHHPSGDVMKICREDDAPYHDATGGAQVWWIDDWDQGVTEPGSSGSPLFDQNGRIIGQLYGGAAACSGAVDNDAYDFYGRFGVSWVNGVSDHLTDCGDADTDDGYDPVISCDGTVSVATEEPACFGLDEGEIILTVADGVAPYTYNIGDGPVASGTFTGLSAGNYTVLITDAEDCVQLINVEILEPSPIVATASTMPEALGEDGSINLSVSGGTPGYNYVWSGPDGFEAFTQDIDGLVSGIYNCTITDDNGCVALEENVVVESTMSVIENEIQLAIYPNPSKGVFTVMQEGTTPVTYTVMDLTGRVVIAQQQLTSATQVIDLTAKASGTYLIQFSTETVTFTQRLIKR